MAKRNKKEKEEVKQSKEYVTRHAGGYKTEEVIEVKRKIKVFNIFLLIVFLLVSYCLIYFVIKIKISNIYVLNNSFLSDQEIIEMAGISDYPPAWNNNFWVVKERLEKSPYIEKAYVTNKWFSQIYIKVEENPPMFYYVSKKRTVLKNGKMVKDEYNVPVLINYVPDKIYDMFLEEFVKLKSDVTLKISEIKYDPNDVDEERFFLTMTDGNYVYLTIDRFDKINSYLSIVKNFDNKKGTLYLDSGEYFEVM